MQAIITKYYGPTNFRGSRIIVTSQRGRMTVPWDHGLSPEDNHLAAASYAGASWGWTVGYDLHGGALPDGRGYAFVLVAKGTK